MGIRQIWIWVASSKVCARMAILSGRGWETELRLENTNSVWTGDYNQYPITLRRRTAVKSIEKNFEIGISVQEVLDKWKVEDLF